MDDNREGPWYRDGLRFECQQCGDCCGKEPGYVWVTDDEVDTISEFLGISREKFLKTYTRKVGADLTLREMANYDCVMLTDDGCKIYEVRPRQCSTFPFWPHNLTSPRAWKRTELRCRGCGKGRLYSLAEMRACMRGESEASE